MRECSCTCSCWAWRLCGGSAGLGATPAAPERKPIKMVVLGDSLSAGLGLPASAAFPARLQKALKAKGIEVDIINAGVSGDTSFGRPRPARLVGAGGYRGRDCRTRRQRRLARHRSGDHARGAFRHSDAAKGPQDRGSLVRHARAAELRQPSIRRGSTRSIRSSPKHSACRCIRFSWRASPPRPGSIRRTALHPTAEGVDVIVEKILPTVEAFLGTISGQRS